MIFTQRRWIQDQQGQQREARWDIDVDVLGATQKWAADRARVERELSAMDEMYPAWALTLAVNMKPISRINAVDVVVPTGGNWRWASDGAIVSSNGELMWDGLLPAPLAGLDRTQARLKQQFPIETIQGRAWTTVPIRVIYPADFPRSEPAVFYDERWLQALKTNSGASHHMLGGGRLCLFYPGHWKRGYTVADVLSQRVINHLYSMLKIANGVSASAAFIGRIHNEAWRPSA